MSPHRCLVRRFGVLLLAALLALAGQGRAAARSGLVLDSLAPAAAAPGVPVSATLTLHSPACTTVVRLGVEVQDATGDDFDFPAGQPVNAQICRQGYTFTTGPRSFPAGTYTLIAHYTDGTGDHRLAPASSLAVTSLGIPTDPHHGRRLIWNEPCSRTPAWGVRWNRTGSTAYPYRTHDPDDGKLDWIDPDDVRVRHGQCVFTAQPSRHTLGHGRRAWTTGMITTEGTRQRFRVRTGEYLEALVTLPTVAGAWPALWTWRGDGNEIDDFEYHTDTPDLLELVNHVRLAADYHHLGAAVATPGGERLRIGVHFGSRSDDWYLNDVLVFSDRCGVGPHWSAYLVLGLSVDDGTWHPAPPRSTPMSFAVDYLRVYR